jgi:tetratricopeptide (TPR) repeat protein
LEKNRIVRSIPTSTKNHLYQLEERFFNIWCLMRLGRKNDRRRATWLVRFLEAWCDEQELAERAERHLGVLREGKLEAGHALLWSQALAQSLRDPDLQQRVLETTRKVLPQVSESLPESDYSLFAKADEAYDRGDFKNAFKYIQPLADKGYPDAMFKTALLYQQQDKLEQAEHYYLMAVEKGDTNAMINLAILYKDEGKVDSAEHYYLMAVEKGSHHAMNNLAALYMDQLKTPRTALELSRKAVGLEPSGFRNLFFGSVALWNEEYLEAFTAIDTALTEFAAEIEGMENILIFFPITMLVAKGQTAFALKLFEDERYRSLNFKERFKPFYYAVLQEIGESRRDDALRMGPELEETVAEVRSQIDIMRQQYWLPADSK